MMSNFDFIIKFMYLLIIGIMGNFFEDKYYRQIFKN